MREPNPCPTCGSPRPEGSPGGMCPRCLLRIGLGDETFLGGPPGPLGVATVPVHLDPPVGEALLLRDEIARGGMGVILRGHDPALGRDVAVKVLLEKHRDRPEMVARFLEEARICGRLEHPGIVSVHGMGTLDDGRPFFAMRLVRGRTLAAILDGRPGDGRDLPRLLGLFLQVCRTVAYAHGRGVVHRDLTPSNVMVGQYGEVLVMDWGLAEVLDGAGNAGPVRGTPGYLSPDLVRGQGRADERADVFSLGAILCEILTGQPPFHAPTPEEVRQRCEAADLSEALARLESSPIDPELADLTRRCLSADPGARPRDAQEVADRLTAHLDGVGERLRRAELDAASARARAAEEKTRRRLAVALATSLVALAAVGGFGLAVVARHRQDLRERARAAMKEVELLSDSAAGDPSGDPAPWRAARDALGRLAAPLAGSSDLISRSRLEALTRRVESGLALAESDARLLDRLEAARSLVDERDLTDAEASFDSAFREAGLDVSRGETIGRVVAGRPRDVARAIVAALDCWAIVRRDRRSDGNPASGPSWGPPLAAARAADPDPWRDALRDALEAGDRQAVARLASANDLETRPASSLWLLGRMLIWAGRFDDCRTALARAWKAHPEDFWINLDLALVLSLDSPRPRDAEPFAVAAVALRPGSATARTRLGILRQALGDLDSAEAQLREAIRLQPGSALAHYNLGNVLGARRRWDDAIACYRKAVSARPLGAHQLRMALGASLAEGGYLAEAEAELLGASRIWPAQFSIWHDLGVVRLRRADAPGAIASLKEALRLVPSGHSEGPVVKEALRQAEGLARCLAAIRGESPPRDNAERVEFVWYCWDHGWDAFASRFYAEAESADPRNLEALGPGHRTAAARRAARAGLGRGKDDPPPSPQARRDCRGLALGWLRDELRARTATVGPVRPEDDRKALEALRSLKTDPDLAAYREPRARDTLAEDERAPWRAFWADLDRAIVGEALAGP